MRVESAIALPAGRAVANGKSIFDIWGAGRAQGYLFEITTEAAVKAHLGRWYGDLVEYITHKRPGTFTTFPP